MIFDTAQRRADVTYRIWRAMPRMATNERPSGVCHLCGLGLPYGQDLCPHHHNNDDDWAATNRVMCGMLHRGITPKRLYKGDREDFWLPDPAPES